MTTAFAPPVMVILVLLVLLVFSLWPSSALSHIPTPVASTKKRTARAGGAASSKWGIRGEEISVSMGPHRLIRGPPLAPRVTDFTQNAGGFFESPVLSS